MATIDQDIIAYQNQGALLTLGTNRIINFSNLQTGIPGEVVVNDTNNDQEWDVPPETATFNGVSATLVGTGSAVVGIRLPILNTLIALSSPVNVAVFASGGVQYFRFYDAEGNDVPPAELLDGLVGQLTSALAAITPTALRNVIIGLVGDPVAFIQTNALLTFNLTANGALIACFTAGTLIATGRGEVTVEDLAVGDLVLTVDRGLQAIRWIGTKKLSPEDLERAPHLAPIRIEAGALGPDLPHATLTVSPQHRCLVRSKIAARMSGEDEVLVAAKHLLGTPGVSIVPADVPVTYVHLLFDRHELVWSNGAVTESLYLGEQAIASVDAAARDEIMMLFPQLAEYRPPAARTFLRGRLARKLVERSVSNRKVLVEGEGKPAKVLKNA